MTDYFVINYKTQIQTSSKAQVESITGLTLPFFHKPITLLKMFATYSDWFWWNSNLLKLNPMRVLFSSNNFNGEILSTCHHYGTKKYEINEHHSCYSWFLKLTDFAALKKLFVSPVTMLDEPNLFLNSHLSTVD